MKYPVAVTIENGVYSAEMPDFPGVITEADTLGELKVSIKEAAFGWIESEIKCGREISKPSSIEILSSNKYYDDCLWLLVDLAKN